MQVFHVTLMRNVPHIRRDGLFPRLGKNSRTAGEPTPAVFCFKNKEDVDNALSNWLGEALEEEGPLAILTLNIDALNFETEDDSFEVRVFETIWPSRIKGIEDEFGKVLPMGVDRIAALSVS